MIKGFTTSQAEKLLEQYGLNVIEEKKKRSIFLVFIDQFNNFLTILLIIAALLSFFVGEKVDGVLILSIVVLNALFGLYQEFKASAAVAALRNMTISRVRVYRDGQEEEIDSKYLVPGDVIFIEDGTKVPADAKLIEVHNLQLNEAALTGESLAVSKYTDDEIFMGTIVSRGRGIAEVTHTGMDTRFGQIAEKLEETEDTATPLQRKLEDLSKNIGLIGIIVSVIVFVLSILDKSSYFTSFLLAISLAVAVVPEGLPAVLTITLAAGVKVMASRKAIVRKLSAIEGLGSVTLIATDKTGTLTTNKMKVNEVYLDKKVYSADKLPSIMHPTFSKLLLDGILCSTSNLVKVHGRNDFEVLGDPTEGALLYLADKVGLNSGKVREQWRLCDEVPFDSVTKLMSVVVEKEDTVRFTKGAMESVLPLCNKVMIKGKKERLSADDKKKIESVAEQWASKGLRVLAFSYCEGTSEVESRSRSYREESEVEEAAEFGVRSSPMEQYKGEVEDEEKLSSSVNSSRIRSKEFLSPVPIKSRDNGVVQRGQVTSANRDSNTNALENFSSSSNNETMKQWNHETMKQCNNIFLGLVAIHDAPRIESREAIRRAKEAGITVVMITGDNEKTAEAVGSAVGLLEKGDEIMNGEEVEKYSDGDLLERLPKVRIFARTTPFHKARIVQLYQKLGEVVAVTGDGVNDAIALKAADVGVAMGLVGTDVARETADMVITDDNFATIVNAIEEGRNVTKNLKNAIAYLLSCNITEALSLVIGLMLGLPTLFYAIQLLYINLVTDGLPALALSFSPKEVNIMKQPPQKVQEILNIHDKKYILWVGFISTVLILGVYFLYGANLVGKTAAFSVLTLIQSFIFVDLWLSHRSIRKYYRQALKPVFFIGFLVPFISQFFIVSQASIAEIFKVTVVPPHIFLSFVVFASSVLVVIKFVKKYLM
jgi:Ca2+-transporting ATPase